MASKKARKARAASPIPAFAKALEALGIRKSKGAKSVPSFAVRETVPRGLAALWKWSDGVKDACFFDPESEDLDDDEGLYFLSVKQAVKESKVTPGPERGIIFGTDLGGTLLVATGAQGRVLQWDHETGELTALASSFDAFLTRCTKALGKRSREETRAKDEPSPLQRAVKAMFERALSASRRGEAIALLNHPKARGGPERDDAWVFDQLAKMLTGAGDAAFVQKQKAAAKAK